MNLSKRLQQIDKMVSLEYDHIWDCCCDHGLLGTQLLKRKAATTIHFVDIVQALMMDLEGKLSKAHPLINHEPSQGCAWKVHCLSAANIALDQSKRNLVIISGVGGDLLIDLVKAIVMNNPNQTIEFLLCPVHHHYKVREALIALNLGLIDECLIKENKRFYEVIHVTTSSNQTISSVGSVMWDFSRRDDQEYLRTTIAHYQRMVKTEDTSLRAFAQRAISAYRLLLAP